MLMVTWMNIFNILDTGDKISKYRTLSFLQPDIEVNAKIRNICFVRVLVGQQALMIHILMI
jgi:hypothetical protein